ncbi:hypothetical protein D3C86_1410840 [compost metagenome]
MRANSFWPFTASVSGTKARTRVRSPSAIASQASVRRAMGLTAEPISHHSRPASKPRPRTASRKSTPIMRLTPARTSPSSTNMASNHSPFSTGL